MPKSRGLGVNREPHHVQQRSPLDVSPDLIPEEFVNPLIGGQAVTGDVWGDEDVWQRPQRAVRW